MSLQRELLGTCAVATLGLLYFCVSSEHPLAPNLTMVIIIAMVQLFSLLSALVKHKLQNQVHLKVERALPAQTLVQTVSQSAALQCIVLFLAVLALLGLTYGSGVCEDLLEVRLDLCLAFLMGGGIRWLALPRRCSKIQNRPCCSQCGDSDCSGSSEDCPYHADFWGEDENKLHHQSQNPHQRQLTTQQQQQNNTHPRQHQYKNDHQHNDVKHFHEKSEDAEHIQKPQQHSNQRSEVKPTLDLPHTSQQQNNQAMNGFPKTTSSRLQELQRLQELDDVKRRFEQLDENNHNQQSNILQGEYLQQQNDVMNRFGNLDTQHPYNDHLGEQPRSLHPYNHCGHMWQQSNNDAIGQPCYPPGQIHTYNEHDQHFMEQHLHQQDSIHLCFNQQGQHQYYDNRYCDEYYYRSHEVAVHHGYQYEHHDNYECNGYSQCQKQVGQRWHHKSTRQQQGKYQHEHHQELRYQQCEYQDKGWYQEGSQDCTSPGKKKNSTSSANSRAKKPMSQMKWVPKEN